jgi:hypothetical protein
VRGGQKSCGERDRSGEIGHFIKYLQKSTTPTHSATQIRKEKKTFRKECLTPMVHTVILSIQYFKTDLDFLIFNVLQLNLDWQKNSKTKVVQ